MFPAVDDSLVARNEAVRSSRSLARTSLNVLQLISSSFGYYGAERVVVTLSTALEELGVHCIVTAFRNTHKSVHLEVLERAKECGLTTEEVPCEGRFDQNAIALLHNLISRHDINVIHCHGIKPILYASLASRSHQIPIIHTCHLWTFDSFHEWLLSAAERCMLHRADRIVAVSEQIVPQLRRFGLRAEVIHNGIRLEQADESGGKIREVMNWGDRPVVAAVGRLCKQKGLTYLLQAAPDVLGAHPETLFVFIGDGPDFEALRLEANISGISNAVRFVGVRKDISALLASIDILAMPSVSEGLPMTLLEAMSSRKAVVASRVGGISRIIEDNVNGITLPPADVPALASALQKLLGDKQLRLSLGNRAKETVDSHFSATAMATQYCWIYRDAMLSSAKTKRGVSHSMSQA